MFTSSKKTQFVAHPSIQSPYPPNLTIDPFIFLQHKPELPVLSHCRTPLTRREDNILYKRLKRPNETTQTGQTPARKLQKIEELILKDGEAMIESQRMFYHMTEINNFTQ